MDYIKAEQLGSYKWRVLAIPFGGQFKGSKDADGEYFSPRTDIKADWFKERPVLWHHGADPAIKDQDLGIEDELTKEEDGWWATLWLDRGARYVNQVNRMLAAGKAYGSSGSIGHLVRYAKDGEILVWPHAEQTLTTMPINLLSRVRPAKAVLDSYDVAGINVDDRFKAVLEELDRIAADDLPSDLPSGGDEAAMKAYADALEDMAALLKRLP